MNIYTEVRMYCCTQSEEGESIQNCRLRRWSLNIKAFESSAKEGVVHPSIAGIYTLNATYYSYIETHHILSFHRQFTDRLSGLYHSVDP